MRPGALRTLTDVLAVDFATLLGKSLAERAIWTDRFSLRRMVMEIFALFLLRAEIKTAK